MGKLEYFRFEVLPHNFSGQHGGEEKIYELEIKYNGQQVATQVAPNLPPYMDELEYLIRLANQARDKLKAMDKESKMPDLAV